MRYNEDWLKDHLIIKEVDRIERQRTLNLGLQRFVKTSPASAAATTEKGILLLRISSNLNDLDYYEVSAAMTGIILSKQKIHDTLLLMTLLQTSLRDLKRRGFNVDRIMNARRAEQEAVEQQRREERAKADLRRLGQIDQQSEQSPPGESHFEQASGKCTETTPAYENTPPSQLTRSDKQGQINHDTTAPSSTAAPQSAKSLFSSFRQRLRQNPDPFQPPALQNSIASENEIDTRQNARISSSPQQHTKTPLPNPESQGKYTMQCEKPKLKGLKFYSHTLIKHKDECTAGCCCFQAGPLWQYHEPD